MLFQKLSGKRPNDAPNISPAAAKGLWVWGKNQYGELGLGDRVSRSSPVQVTGSTLWSSVTGGIGFRIGVKGDGTLWSWGNNFAGELGLGDTVKRSSPTQIGTLALWSKAVAADYERAGFAIRTNGTLWSWGYAGYGGLGNGTNSISSPVQVGTLGNWANVSFGRQTAIAVKTDGTLWSWGRNQHGQSGVGDTTNWPFPVQVGTLANWASAFMTFSSAVATKTDGTLWTWGNNKYGGLGDGTTIYRSSPVQIGTLTTWSQVTGTFQSGIGGGSPFARRTDGTIWVWGKNTNKLGLGDAVYRSSPTQIGTLATWSSLASGINHHVTTAIMTNGTLWAWGANTYGSLGTGDAILRSVPAQVGTLTDWVAPSVHQADSGGHGLRLA